MLSLLTSPVSANKTYPSGAVTTENKWTMQYGRLDVRAKLTGGNGLWPAIWLLPVGQANWASDYEIDLMEMLGKDPHTVYFTLHYAEATKQQQCQMTGPDFSAGFHTFTLLWRPGSAEWEVDGIVQCTITGEGVSTEPMYLLVNDAVGGAWPGEPDATTPLPQTMLVNYVRASALT
jgi:beta-glucanase (GH16 family)